MRYPGGKNQAGVYQRIICQMPPHRTYVEPFLGSGAILRLKRAAERSLGFDLDPGAIATLGDAVPPGTQLYCEDGIAALETIARDPVQHGRLIYCDPPYLNTLWPQKYRYKMNRSAHERLLKVLLGLRCHVLISGYWDGLYASTLRDWRLVRWEVTTRGGCRAEECLWCNFPEPTELHDYRYLGDGFRERANFTRQQRRWAKKLAGMGRLQRLALMAALQEVSPDAAVSAAGSGSGGNGDGRSVIAGNGVASREVSRKAAKARS